MKQTHRMIRPVSDLRNLKLAETERSESEQKRYTLSEAREKLGEMLRG